MHFWAFFFHIIEYKELNMKYDNDKEGKMNGVKTSDDWV